MIRKSTEQVSYRIVSKGTAHVNVSDSSNGDTHVLVICVEVGVFE